MAGVIYGDSSPEEWNDLTSYGGQGRRINPATGQQVTPSGAQVATSRFQSMGADASNREAYQQNFNNNYAARDQQNYALEMQRNAAMGNAPSRAEILGQHMADDQVNAAMAIAGGASGGPAAQAAAQRTANANAATTMQANTNAIAGLRADEMARARSDYMAGATGQRGEDLSQVGLETQNEQFQRGLNQQGQLSYEQMAQKTQEDQMQAAMHAQDVAQSEHAHQGDINQHSTDRSTSVIGGIAGGVGGAIGSALGMFSDPRAKAFLAPMATANGAPVQPAYARFSYPPISYSDPRAKATLEPMGRQAPMGSLPPWLPPFTYPSTTLLTSSVDTKVGMGDLSAGEGLHDYTPTASAGSSSGGPSATDFAGSVGSAFKKGGNWSGLTSAPWSTESYHPFHAEHLQLSDDRAKLAAAWDEGATFATNRMRDFSQLPPEELHKRAERSDIAYAMDRGRMMGAGPSIAPWNPPSNRAQLEQPPPPQAAPPAQMMDAIGPGKTFRYKPGIPGTDPNEQHYGTTTQDLRQTPMGGSMVTTDPATGYEAIDTREAVGPTLASLGNLNQRVRALEGEEYPPNELGERGEAFRPRRRK